MIQEKYCSFELSKKLKEAGFNEPTDYYYRNSGVKAPSKSKVTNYCCQCPSLGHAMDWLRTEHGFHIALFQDAFQNKEDSSICISYDYAVQVVGTKLNIKKSDDIVYSYEEAAEIGISKVLELI